MKFEKASKEKDEPEKKSKTKDSSKKSKVVEEKKDSKDEKKKYDWLNVLSACNLILIWF